MTLAADLTAATAKAKTAADLMHAISTGPATGPGSQITTPGGPAYSLARVRAESEALRDLAGSTLESVRFNEAALLTAGGRNSGIMGLSRAVVVSDDGDYNHFIRGLRARLKNGEIAFTHYKGRNHGGGDDDALFLLKQIVASGDLTFDGQLGNGTTTATLTVPQQLLMRFFTNQTGRIYTITGTAVINGVDTATTEIVNGLNVGTYVTTRIWKSFSINCDGPTTGGLSIGVRQAASSGMFRMTRDGGRTTYNDHALVDGLNNQVDQFYQSALFYSNEGEFIALYFKQTIGIAGFKTVRNVNSANGHPSGWSGETEVLFKIAGTTDNPTATVAGGIRPIFHSQGETRPSGTLVTFFQGGSYLWRGTSTDKGATWSLVQLIKMARTDCDVLVISASSTGAKTFGVAGDVAARFPTGRKFLVWNSTANVHNGVYTVTGAVHSAGTTTITVSETVNSDTASGQISMSGVVAVNTGTRTWTFGGDHTAALAAGDVICLNNSAGNDKLYTIQSRALNADTKNTDVTVVEAIAVSTVSGRIQNATLGEFGIGWLDGLTAILVGRLVGGGQSFAEQFRIVDGGESAATYVGRPTNTVSGNAVSHHLVVSRIGGRDIVKWYYHWRAATGNAYSICYRTGDGDALFGMANAWMPEKVIVSTTTPMYVDGVGLVYSSATYKRHGYPFVVPSEDGETDLLYFSLETSNTASKLYCVAVKPELQQYFGGRILIARAVLTGASDVCEFTQDLDAFTDIEVEADLSADAAGFFSLRTSEDRGATFPTSGYLTRGASGSATSHLPMNNASVSSGTATELFARLLHCNDATRATLVHASGGNNNSSTSGGPTKGKRATTAVLNRLQVLNTGGGKLTGTIEIYGRCVPQRG